LKGARVLGPNPSHGKGPKTHLLGTGVWQVMTLANLDTWWHFGPIRRVPGSCLKHVGSCQRHQVTLPKDTPVGYGICSTLEASRGGNSHWIQRDKRNTKIYHFLTITDCIAWPIAFCLHLDGEGGEGERGCVSLLGVLIQHYC
jgi:hypothetical protein